MSLCSKLEVKVEIMADATAFHDVFSCRPHHVANIIPETVQGCELHDGEWGKEGSVINWNFVHDGKEMTAKEVIEEIDDVNNSTTFKVIEGDLLKEYAKFKIKAQATPKKDGGSLVHWTFEYELKHDQVPHPETLIDLAVQVTKDIDAHLVEAASG